VKDNIKDIFESALRSQELPVRPDLWNGVQAGITQSAVGAASSSALLAKIIGGGLAASLIVVGSVYLFSGSDSVSNKSILSTEAKKEKRISKTNTLVVERVVNQNGSSSENNNPLAVLAQNNSVERADVLLVAPKAREIVVKLLEKDVTKQVEEKKEYPKIADGIEDSNPVVINPLASSGKSVVIGDLPNIFTPNGDGHNDVLKVNIQNVKEFQVTIMDQNNRTVFTSSDSNFEWAGLDMSSNMVASGEYIYFIIGKGNDNIEFKEFKRLTIK
jgi:gliding motility-associated-like protein